MAGGLALVTASLVWLLFGLGADRLGMSPLRDAPGVRAEFIADVAAGATREAIAALPETAWRPWIATGYVSAPPGEVLWMRVHVANPLAEPMAGVLADTSYFSDRVDAWLANTAGGWRHEVSGDAVPGPEKPLWGRLAAFPVTVPAQGERVIYLRVSDNYVAHIQPTWWPHAEDFFQAQLRRVLAECICYGALLALVFYNFVLWLRLRFADIGYYVFAAAASAAWNVVANGGFALAGVKLGSPLHEMLLAALFACSSGGMLQFARVFLGTKTLLPRADRWLHGWWLALVGVALVVPFMPWMKTPLWLSVTAVATMLTDILYFSVAVVAWRAGAGHARFFVVAFALLVVAIGPALVSVLRGDIAAGVAMGLLSGRTMEMLLLSFAVADRFAQTQRALIEETEQRRAIEEAYADELETEVRERTRELRQANADKDRILTVIGHDLRSPLTGVMRLAENHSGEFGREVTRVGRALLLLIEDLVLWARLRAGTRQIAAHPLRGLAAPAVALHQTLAGHGAIELVVDVPDEVQVRTDLVLAQTLVRNLLANALKFAEARVVLRAGADGHGGVRFTVGNDGPPLAPEVAARFAAGKDEPITATGGLGLRLCREICAALGTRLEAGEARAGGTEFSFMLQIATGSGAPNS